MIRKIIYNDIEKRIETYEEPWSLVGRYMKVPPVFDGLWWWHKKPRHNDYWFDSEGNEYWRDADLDEPYPESHHVN